jgi:hypothetical protein
MMKVPAWVVVLAMMTNAFLLYLYTELAKLPSSRTLMIILVSTGGALASLGIFLGLVKSPISVSVETATTTVTTTSEKPTPTPAVQ